jgi:hypothetical protein
VRQPFSRPVGILLVAAVLAAVSAGGAGVPAASADVCTGGAPAEIPSSTPPLLASVPFLEGPRWSREVLPQWSETRASIEWGDQLAYAWYRRARLWDATSTAAWWVIPGLGCEFTSEDASEAYEHEGNAYEPQACVLLYAQLALAGFDCRDPRQLALPGPPVSVERAGRTLVAGFAQTGTGSVQVGFQHGAATFPAAGGVYGGSVSASLGRALTATAMSTILGRARTAVALVDQTGLSSPSQGPLASTPRLRTLAAEIHARIPAVAASILGTAVTGRREHDEVLYGAGARALASRVARALHAAPPRALGEGAQAMFAGVARVVVLVGRSD